MGRTVGEREERNHRIVSCAQLDDYVRHQRGPVFTHRDRFPDGDGTGHVITRFVVDVLVLEDRLSGALPRRPPGPDARSGKGMQIAASPIAMKGSVDVEQGRTSRGE